MIHRHVIVACARQFLGVRFAHQGRSEEGLDCLGLLLATASSAKIMFDEKNVHALDVPTYGMRPDIDLLRRKLDQFLLTVPSNALQPADIVLLKVAGSPQHLALITDYPMAGELGMIHAYAPARKVVEHRYDSAWRQVTHACFRLPNISEF